MSVLPRFETPEQALAFIDDPASNSVLTWIHERSDLLRPHVDTATELLWDAQILQLHGGSFRERPYLGPMAEFGGNKIPDPNAFPPEATDYAIRRAAATRNAILAARYFDFAYEQRGEREWAGAAIDAYLLAVGEHLRHDDAGNDETFYRASQAVEAFGRAFAISLDQGFEGKRTALVQEGLKLLAEFVRGTQQRHLSLATQIVEALLMWRAWEDQQQLEDARGLLEQAVVACSTDSFLGRSFLGLIELITSRLHDTAGVTSARRRLAESEEAEADGRTDSGLVRSVILRRALGAYSRVPDPAACTRVEAKLRDAIAQSDAEMHTVEHSTTLDFNTWDPYIEQLMADAQRDAVFHLVANDANLPKRETARNLAIETTERYPLRSLVTNIVIKNETLHFIETREQFLDAETWKNYGMELSMRFAYLGRAVRMMQANGVLDASRVLEALEGSELFAGRQNVWSVAVERYFAADYVSFLHVMLPQIEEAFRALLKRTGRRVMTVGRNGQLELKPLGGLLASLRDLIDQGVMDFFEFVLCHQQGWNLRNTVTHGLAEEAVFSWHVADIVMWVALRLSLFQVTVKAQSEPARAP